MKKDNLANIKAVFIAANFVFVPVATWQLFCYYFPKIGDSERAMITATSMLVLFSFLTWLTYERLAKLADRQNWLTGALETHSTTELIMRAHERGIPVMWWDPNREEWDAAGMRVPSSSKREHRTLVSLSVIPLYLPENERATCKATTAKRLTQAEIKAIKSEQKRLQKLNAPHVIAE